MKKMHNVDEVIRSLSKKRDCKVFPSGNINSVNKVVEILYPAENNDLGNGSWGKIDFLVNHNGYSKRFVSKFSKSE